MLYVKDSEIVILVLQKYKMNFDKNSGVIEMIMESLTPADEGTFTFQLKDGKATNQSSLVLIGDGTHENILRDSGPSLCQAGLQQEFYIKSS